MFFSSLVEDHRDKMVLFGSKKTHGISIMQAMQKLRQEGSLCDAFLKVGDQRVQAHGCVLVAGSDYFRARFIGPMKEEGDKLDVDLSSITSDVDYVEKVVNFLYEGVIDIDQENLEQFLKLASFLLISELREHCVRFMENTAGMQVGTIVKYYLLATDFMLPDIETKLKNMVKTRFHDWLIFDESILQVSTGQLRFLMATCDIFEFCSGVDMLRFIIEWVKKGNSEVHDVLGCELLEMVRKKKDDHNTENRALNEELKSVIEKLTSFDKDENQDSEFMTTLRELLDDLMMNSTKCDIQELECTFKRLSASPDVSTLSDTEPMVLTISPKSCLKKELLKRPQTNSEEDNEMPFKKNKSIFDICAYVPRTMTWYLLKEGQYNGLFKNIVYEEGVWYFCGLFDTMYCLSPYARCYSQETLHFLSLCDFSSPSISYEDVIRSRLEPDERAFQNMCIIGENKSVYLVSLISDIGHGLYVDPKHFQCFKLTPRNKWAFVCRTPTFQDNSRYGGVISGALSAVSNEMILIYCVVTPRSYPKKVTKNVNPDDVPSELFAFVATLGKGKSSHVKVHRLSAEYHKSQIWQILQDEHQFYLLEGDHIDAGFRLAYRYKYVFNSNVLTPVNSNEEIVRDVKMSRDESESCYLIHKTDSHDGRSVWMYSGNELNASNLTEASLDNYGNVVVKAHKPPPFSCVTAFMAGNMNTGCLTGATPVTRYLKD